MYAGFTYQRKTIKKIFYLREIFFLNIFKTLNRVGHYIVHITLNTFFDIPSGLAVAASLPMLSSLILVL